MTVPTPDLSMLTSHGPPKAPPQVALRKPEVCIVGDFSYDLGIAGTALKTRRIPPSTRRMSGIDPADPRRNRGWQESHPDPVSLDMGGRIVVNDANDRIPIHVVGLFIVDIRILP